MRNVYFNTLKKIFWANLLQTRTTLRLTQAQMAEILAMDTRSYIDLDHGKNMCSALTLVLFLLYCCHEPNEFLEEVRSQFDALKKIA